MASSTYSDVKRYRYRSNGTSGLKVVLEALLSKHDQTQSHVNLMIEHLCQDCADLIVLPGGCWLLERGQISFLDSLRPSQIERWNTSTNGTNEEGLLQSDCNKSMVQVRERNRREKSKHSIDA